MVFAWVTNLTSSDSVLAIAQMSCAFSPSTYDDKVGLEGPSIWQVVAFFALSLHAVSFAGKFFQGLGTRKLIGFRA